MLLSIKFAYYGALLFFHCLLLDSQACVYEEPFPQAICGAHLRKFVYFSRNEIHNIGLLKGGNAATSADACKQSRKHRFLFFFCQGTPTWMHLDIYKVTMVMLFMRDLNDHWYGCF